MHVFISICVTPRSIDVNYLTDSKKVRASGAQMKTVSNAKMACLRQ